MTELEILAELKIAYLNLEDIQENNEEQITKKENVDIEISMRNLEIVYNNLFNRIMKTNKDILYYEKDTMIADIINADYVTDSKDYDNQYLCYDDIKKETKWWEDIDFLLGY